MDEPNVITERGDPRDRVANQREHRPAQLPAIAAGSTDLDRVARLGLWLAAAESKSTDPKVLGMSAALRIAYAEHLGLPAHAASEIHLIRGNLALSAKLCRGLARQHGIRLERVDVTDDSCTAIVFGPDGTELGRTTYTLAMAAKAGLRGDNWTRNPDRMLWARASKRALDDFAPWVTVGVQALEELDPQPEQVLPILPEEAEQEVLPFEDAD
jgi:hypothetical protein